VWSDQDVSRAYEPSGYAAVVVPFDAYDRLCTTKGSRRTVVGEHENG
jgi:hypothetical protein